jgi:hypothetical protein
LLELYRLGQAALAAFTLDLLLDAEASLGMPWMQVGRDRLPLRGGTRLYGPPTPAYCPAHALRSSFNRFTAESNLTLPASSASQGSDFQAR